MTKRSAASGGSAGDGAAAGYQLDPADLAGLTSYLQRQEFLAPEEHVTAAARAGDGNMNLTLRVTTPARSIIVKQGRPWVEKYPQIPAPAQRTVVEGRFYAAVQQTPALAQRMPRLLGRDARSSILILQDFPDARDHTDLYSGVPLDASDAASLVSYLSCLHQLSVPPAERPLLHNPEMRALNHEHMFRFPLDPQNGLQLDTITDGLGAAAGELAADPRYVQRVRTLGAHYLEWDTGPLNHGDFFPGSWLRTADGIKVIDPEFCFFGPREFDLGVMVAHLYLAAQSRDLISDVLSRYERFKYLDRSLVYTVAGVEIMRRLIGVAQLPLRADLATKRKLLTLSRSFVLGTTSVL